MGEQFTIDYVIQVLTGKATATVQMYRHDALDVFASGNDQEPHYWNSLIRQMLLAEFLEKDIVEYGVLKITKAGHAFLKNQLHLKSLSTIYLKKPMPTKMKPMGAWQLQVLLMKNYWKH